MDEQYFNSEINDYKKMEEKTFGYTKQLYWDFAIGLQKVEQMKN